MMQKLNKTFLGRQGGGKIDQKLLSPIDRLCYVLSNNSLQGKTKLNENLRLMQHKLLWIDNKKSLIFLDMKICKILGIY